MVRDSHVDALIAGLAMGGTGHSEAAEAGAPLPPDFWQEEAFGQVDWGRALSEKQARRLRALLAWSGVLIWTLPGLSIVFSPRWLVDLRSRLLLAEEGLDAGLAAQLLLWSWRRGRALLGLPPSYRAYRRAVRARIVMDAGVMRDD